METESAKGRVWFLLVDTDGRAYKNSTITSIFVSDNMLVDDVRKAVKAEMANILAHIDAGELVVFRDMDSFRRHSARLPDDPQLPQLDIQNDDYSLDSLPLRNNEPLAEFGQSYEHHLVILVSSHISMEVGTRASCQELCLNLLFRRHCCRPY